MLLISLGPNPVTVLLCFGRVKAGPTGPCKSASGALVEGLRSRGEGLAAILMIPIAVSSAASWKVILETLEVYFVEFCSEKRANNRELLRECRCERRVGGVEGRIAALPRISTVAGSSNMIG
jgi:hypothetical protein